MKDEGKKKTPKKKEKIFRMMLSTNTIQVKSARPFSTAPAFIILHSTFYIFHYSLRPPCTNTSRGLPASAVGAINPSRSMRSIMRAARL